ncbi:MAG: nuclear transport factor 2 family protein [Gemmatimonadetes bacterium]|nr:nuclear transport factor 2 family protein [Gemmatimonadota bacterium]
MRFIVLSAVVVAALASAPVARAQDAKAEVLAVGQSLFDAMAKRDTAAIRRLMFPGAILVAAADDNGTPAPRSSSLEQFIEQIAKIPYTPVERMWNAQVNVSGTIASIWTQYDFHRGAEFSHCGIDAFHLVKTPTGWRINSLIYTLVRERCPKNPAGPPR